ncbi:MAG: RimK/LysX family protein [Pseudomonadota bacterium]
MRLTKAHGLLGTLVLVGGLAGGWYAAQWRVLGAIETVVVTDVGLPFAARLDTGATISSINAVNIVIEGRRGDPRPSDKGKVVKFTLINGAGEQVQARSKVVQVRGIRTADCRELRYHVYLSVTFRGKTKRVLMNLNDRSRSSAKLLLGRNWIAPEFAVSPRGEG